MVRRTRRDLTNKRVRKIIKKKQREASPHSSFGQSPSKKPSILKSASYVVLAALVVFVLYKVSETVNFEDFFSADSNAHQIVKMDGQGTSSISTSERSGDHENPVKENTLEPVPQLIQVEVLNGCGVSGLATAATEYLRDTKKIDVVSKGNYKNFNVEKSQIIDRTGDMDEALEIAEILGIEKSLVSSDVDFNKQLSATIILGKDYKELNPFNKE